PSIFPLIRSPILWIDPNAPTPAPSFRAQREISLGVGGCNVFSNASPTPTRPARAPFLFHRPHTARSHLLRPCRLPRRCPPEIPRLWPPRLRRPLHHQNRNRNLRRLKTNEDTMTTTIIENTNIKELLEVSAGNMKVLQKMTEEFRQKVQERFKRTEPPSRNVQILLKSPGEPALFQCQQKLTIA